MKKKISKRTYYVSLIIVLFVSVIVTQIKHSWKVASEQFADFYPSDIAGIIENVKLKNQATFIKIENHKFGYVFSPYSIKENGDLLHFRTMANVGDSVYKEPYSDTLHLIQKNKVYKFTFTKCD